jgi:hypothetical protein
VVWIQQLLVQNPPRCGLRNIVTRSQTPGTSMRASLSGRHNILFNIGSPASSLSTSICHIWQETASFSQRWMSLDSEALVKGTFQRKDVQLLDCYVYIST